jgi:hypothetical protein
LAAERAGAPVEVEVFLHADHDLHVQHPGRLADVLEKSAVLKQTTKQVKDARRMLQWQLRGHRQQFYAAD